MRKILIVDDEQEIAACLKEEFEFLGHQVSLTTDPEEARTMAMNENYDIIMLDIMMPKLNGLDLADQIRPHTDAKIVFLSAIADMMGNDPKISNADMILEKPYSISDIQKVLGD